MGCRSLTGAWIETASLACAVARYCGRSLTGAWIETLSLGIGTKTINGRSLTGAWIETQLPVGISIESIWSLPYGGVD